MAKSEGQGLQIAVIIFAFLTIALSVSTFYFFNEWSTADDERKKAQTDTTAAKQAQQTLVDDAIQLKKDVIGVDDQMKVDAIKQQLQGDMAKYGATFPKDKQFYRPALELLVNSLLTTKKDVLGETVKLQQLEQRINTLQNDFDKRVAATKAAFDGKGQDFITTKGTFTEKERQLLTQINDLNTQMNQKRQELADSLAKSQQQITKVKKDLTQTTASLLNVKNTLNDLTNETFERPDGRVVWVSPSSQSVWLNVGRADRLREQIKFSVYAANYSFSDDAGKENARSGRKAVVEVTKLLGDNLAEARILDDDIRNPIISGDLINTPLWTPGRPEHFALAGDFDVNRDGAPDNSLMRTLISLAGGVIDAETDDKGQVKGKMDVGTRYLITGLRPKANSDGYDTMRNDAANLGIRTMTLEQLLDRMGGDAAIRRAVDLDPRTRRPEDFKGVPRIGEGGRVFKPRHPPSSAYDK